MKKIAKGLVLALADVYKRQVNNLRNRNAIATDTAKTMLAALNERAYICLTPRQRDMVRAAILKNMLLTQIS